MFHQDRCISRLAGQATFTPSAGFTPYAEFTTSAGFTPLCEIHPACGINNSLRGLCHLSVKNEHQSKFQEYKYQENSIKLQLLF